MREMVEKAIERECVKEMRVAQPNRARTGGTAGFGNMRCVRYVRRDSWFSDTYAKRIHRWGPQIWGAYYGYGSR
jgi:hypothetical protein